MDTFSLTAFSPDSISLKASYDVAVLPDSATENTTGLLYICEENLYFVASDTKPYCFPYTSIGLHAISSDTSSSNKPFLYCQITTPRQSANNTTDDEDTDDDYESFMELRIFPTVEEELHKMFEFFSECAALHPDPEDGDHEMGDTGNGGNGVMLGDGFEFLNSLNSGQGMEFGEDGWIVSEDFQEFLNRNTSTSTGNGQLEDSFEDFVNDSGKRTASSAGFPLDSEKRVGNGIDEIDRFCDAEE